MRRFMVIYYDGWDTKKTVINSEEDLVQMHDTILLDKYSDNFEVHIRDGTGSRYLQVIQHQISAVIEVDPTKEPNVRICL